MKNLLFWGGLFLATFWDEMLLMATDSKKTKRQQQFLKTGETSQYFIGAVEEPEEIKFLGTLFKKKKVKYSYFNATTDVWSFNGGVKNGGFYLEKLYDGNLYLFIATTKYSSYDMRDNPTNNAMGFYKFYTVFFDYIFIWNYVSAIIEKTSFYDTEEWQSISAIAYSEDYELALVLLSGIPNIKEILST